MFKKKEKRYSDAVIVNEQQVSLSDLRKKAKNANRRFVGVTVSTILMGSMILPYMSNAAVADSSSNVFKGEVIPGYSMGGVEVAVFGVDPNSTAAVTKDTVVGSTYGIWSGDRLDSARSADALGSSTSDDGSGDASEVSTDKALNLSSTEKAEVWGKITQRTTYSISRPNGITGGGSTRSDNIAPYRTVADYNHWNETTASANWQSVASTTITASLYADFIIVNITGGNTLNLLVAPDSVPTSIIKDGKDENDFVYDNADANKTVPYYVPLSALFNDYQLTKPEEATIDNLMEKMKSDTATLVSCAKNNNLLEKTHYYAENTGKTDLGTAFNPYPYTMAFKQQISDNGYLYSSIYNNSECYVYFQPSSVYDNYLKLRQEYYSLYNSYKDANNENPQGDVVFRLGYYLAEMSILEAYLDEALPQDMTRGYVGPTEPKGSYSGEQPGDGSSALTSNFSSVNYATLLYDVAHGITIDAGAGWRQSETDAIMDTLSTFGYFAKGKNSKYAVDTGTGVMKGLDRSGVFNRLSLFSPYIQSKVKSLGSYEIGPEMTDNCFAGLYMPTYFPIQQHLMPNTEGTYRFQILSTVPYNTLLEYIKAHGFSGNVDLTFSGSNKGLENFATITTAKNSVAVLAAQYEQAEADEGSSEYTLSNADIGKISVLGGGDVNAPGDSDAATTESRIDAALLNYNSASLDSDNVHDLYDIVRATKNLKKETWVRFYNPLKSEGGESDLFITRISPAATTYMPQILLQGYTPAGGTIMNTSGSDGKAEVSNAISPNNCSYDYFSIPSFAPCFAAHTKRGTYYGVLNYELRSFYSKGFIETLSKHVTNGNIPVPALEEYEKAKEQLQKAEDKTKTETGKLNKNIAAVYIMAKRLAYLQASLAVPSTVYTPGDIRFYSDLYPWGTGITENGLTLDDNEKWSVPLSENNNIRALNESAQWAQYGTMADFWDPKTNADYPLTANDDDTMALVYPDTAIPFTGRGKVEIAGANGENTIDVIVHETTSTQSSGGSASGKQVVRIYATDWLTDAQFQSIKESYDHRWPGVLDLLNPIRIDFDDTYHWSDKLDNFDEMLSKMKGKETKTGTSDMQGTAYIGGYYFSSDEDKYYYLYFPKDGYGLHVVRDIIISKPYDDARKALLCSWGTYYWDDEENIKALIQGGVHPSEQEGAPSFDPSEANKYTVRMCEGVLSAFDSKDKSYGTLIDAYQNALDEASGEIGKQLVNLARAYNLIADTMPTKMQNCLAWGDYQNSSDSENQYSSDPSEANVTININYEGGDDLSNLPDNAVKSVNDLDQYGLELVPDGDDRKIRMKPDKVDDDTSAESRMVRGVEGATATATLNPAVYTISSTIFRVQQLTLNNGSAFPYSGLYAGRLQSGTDRYSELQAHVIDYTSIASGIAGDLSKWQETHVVSITEPQYTSASDVLPDALDFLAGIFKEIGNAIMSLSANAFKGLMFNEGPDARDGSGASKSNAAMNAYRLTDGTIMLREPASLSSYNWSTGELEYATVYGGGSSNYQSANQFASADTYAGTSMVGSAAGMILTGLEPIYAAIQSLALMLVMAFIAFIAFRNFFAYSVKSDAAMVKSQMELKVVLPRTIIAIFMIGLPPIGAGMGFEGGNFILLRLLSDIITYIGGIFLGLNAGGVMNVFTNIDLVASFGANIAAYIFYLIACVILAVCFFLGCIIIIVQVFVLFFFYLFGPIVWSLYVWPYAADVNNPSAEEEEEEESENGNNRRSTRQQTNSANPISGFGSLAQNITPRMNLGFFTSNRAGNLAPLGHVMNYIIISSLSLVWIVMFWFVAMIFVAVAGIKTSGGTATAATAIMSTGYPYAAAETTDLIGMLLGGVGGVLRIIIATLLAVVVFALMAWLLFKTLKKQFEGQKGIIGATGTAIMKAGKAYAGARKAPIKAMDALAKKGIDPGKALQSMAKAKDLGQQIKQQKKNMAKNGGGSKADALALQSMKNARKAARKNVLKEGKQAAKDAKNAKMAQAKKGAKTLMDEIKRSPLDAMLTDAMTNGQWDHEKAKSLMAAQNAISATAKSIGHGNGLNTLAYLGHKGTSNQLERAVKQAGLDYQDAQREFDAFEQLNRILHDPNSKLSDAERLEKANRMLTDMAKNDPDLLYALQDKGALKEGAVQGKFELTDMMTNSDKSSALARQDLKKALDEQCQQAQSDLKAQQSQKAIYDRQAKMLGLGGTDLDGNVIPGVTKSMQAAIDNLEVGVVQARAKEEAIADLKAQAAANDYELTDAEAEAIYEKEQSERTKMAEAKMLGDIKDKMGYSTDEQARKYLDYLSGIPGALEAGTVVAPITQREQHIQRTVDYFSNIVPSNADVQTQLNAIQQATGVVIPNAEDYMALVVAELLGKTLSAPETQQLIAYRVAAGIEDSGIAIPALSVALGALTANALSGVALTNPTSSTLLTNGVAADGLALGDMVWSNNVAFDSDSLFSMINADNAALANFSSAMVDIARDRMVSALAAASNTEEFINGINQMLVDSYAEALANPLIGSEEAILEYRQALTALAMNVADSVAEEHIAYWNDNKEVIANQLGESLHIRNENAIITNILGEMMDSFEGDGGPIAMALGLRNLAEAPQMTYDDYLGRLDEIKADIGSYDFSLETLETFGDFITSHYMGIMSDPRVTAQVSVLEAQHGISRDIFEQEQGLIEIFSNMTEAGTDVLSAMLEGVANAAGSIADAADSANASLMSGNRRALRGA